MLRRLNRAIPESDLFELIILMVTTGWKRIKNLLNFKAIKKYMMSRNLIQFIIDLQCTTNNKLFPVKIILSRLVHASSYKKLVKWRSLMLSSIIVWLLELTCGVRRRDGIAAQTEHPIQEPDMRRQLFWFQLKITTSSKVVDF